MSTTRPTTKLGVLYIEDKPGERRTIAKHLRARGFRVSTAASGEEGLKRLEKLTPDVVLSDLNMPGMSGLEVLSRIRRRHPGLPVVLLTAHGSVDLARQAIKKGAYRFLGKPVRTAELELTIHQAIEHEHLQARGRLTERLEQTVAERTESLRKANSELRANARVVEDSRIQLAEANVSLLAARDELAQKNSEMESLLRELSKSQEELQTILDSSPSAVIMVDPERNIVAANQRVEEYFGIPADELLLSSVDALFVRVRACAQDPDAFDEIVQRERSKEASQELLDVMAAPETTIQLTVPETRHLAVHARPVVSADGRALGQVWVFSDVTRIKEADDRLRLIIEASPIPCIITRISDGKILYANERMGSLAGLASRDLIGRVAPDFYVNPDDRIRLLSILRRDGSVSNFETRIRQVDGTKLWVVFSIATVELAGERVILGGIYDVTERKLALDALEKERNFVSAVLDTVGALVLVLDREGRIVRFNAACEQTTGYLSDEVLGKTIWDLFILPEEIEGVRTVFAALVGGATSVPGKNYWLTRSGEKRLIAWSNTCLTGSDGRVEYVVATGIDITERHLAQEKLRLYTLIYDRSNDGILVFDAEGRFVERNPAHRLLSGYRDEDLEGRTGADLFGEDVFKNVYDAVRREGSYRGEIKGRRVDGQVVPIDASVFSISDSTGALKYVVGIGRDVTERKKNEEALRRAHDELEQRVLERTAELARVNEALLAEVSERKQAEEALRTSHQQLAKQNAVLAELAKRLSPEHGDLASSLGELTEAASRTLDVGRVGVWLYRDDRDAIEALDTYDGKTGGHDKGQMLFAADFPSYFKALRLERTVTAHDAHVDPRTREFSESYLTPNGISSMLDAPIWLEGRMVGVVCLEHVGPARRWTPEEERFAASVADFASLTIEAHQRKSAEEALRRAHVELELRVDERTAQLAKMNVAYRDEINERRQAQEALATRLTYEEGLALCSQALLTGESENAVGEALQHLLRASGATGVYIFENFEDPEDGLSMRQTFDVCQDSDLSGPLTLVDPSLQKIPYARFERWRSELPAGKPIGGFVAAMPQVERDFFEQRGILSMLALPIFVEGAWYGFMGFMDRTTERNWSREDIRSLKTAAQILGVYLHRKRVTEALRVSEERFRTLVENANDIIFSMRADGSLSYISPNFSDATGFTIGEFLGGSFLTIMHPDERDAAQDWLRNGFKTAERVSGYEHRFRHVSGSFRWFVTSASVLKDERGDVREIIGISHDITRLKQVLDDFARANVELREAQSQLVHSEKMASLGMLVAGIAHEINSPIGALSSYHDTLVRGIEKLRSGLEAEFPGQLSANPALAPTFAIIQDANRVIQDGAERVTSIVRRLRSFARLDEAELKRVDVHEGLEDTLTLIHHELKHNITVKREFGSVPPIACFPGRLNQVFLNLINNARQAITGKGEITIRTFVEDSRVHIAFTDTGSGIPPEHLRKIFDPGFTTKGVGVGTGLGLSICYQIIRDHRGEIRVRSELGRGSTFTIVLPMDLSETAAAARQPALEARR